MSRNKDGLIDELFEAVDELFDSLFGTKKQEPKKEKPPSHKIEIEDSSWKYIEELGALYGITGPQLIAKSIKLMGLVTRALKAGNSFIIRDAEGKETKIEL